MTEDPDDFAGMRAIVTGGGAGIGLAAARVLSRRGARVACLDLDPRDVDAPLAGIICDVADDASVRAAVARAAQALGGIDIVINNAGVGARGDIDANSDAEWHRLFDINVLGMVRTGRAALAWLRRSSHASIVNVGSTVATVGLPDRVLYSATKGAIAAMSRAMAADFIDLPIRVNCVMPGVVDTAWQQRAVAAAPDPAARMAQLRGLQPTGAMVSVNEVADAIAYLAGPQSRSTTGIELVVDGGLTSLRTALRA